MNSEYKQAIKCTCCNYLKFAKSRDFYATQGHTSWEHDSENRICPRCGTQMIIDSKRNNNGTITWNSNWELTSAKEVSQFQWDNPKTWLSKPILKESGINIPDNQWWQSMLMLPEDKNTAQRNYNSLITVFGDNKQVKFLLDHAFSIAKKELKD